VFDDLGHLVEAVIGEIQAIPRHYPCFPEELTQCGQVAQQRKKTKNSRNSHSARGPFLAKTSNGLGAFGHSGLSLEGCQDYERHALFRNHEEGKILDRPKQLFRNFALFQLALLNGHSELGRLLRAAGRCGFSHRHPSLFIDQ
jgi:hypothetical protein